MILPTMHDDVIKWKHFPLYWPFVQGIHRSPVNSPHKGQWRGALMFTLICARINGWVNNGEAGDLRHNRAHYDVIVMVCGRLHVPHLYQVDSNNIPTGKRIGKCIHMRYEVKLYIFYLNMYFYIIPVSYFPVIVVLLCDVITKIIEGMNITLGVKMSPSWTPFEQHFINFGHPYQRMLCQCTQLSVDKFI